MSYHVTATRWAHGWELHIEGVGVTQSRTLTTAEATVRDYLELDEYVDHSTAEIVIKPELGGNLAAEAEAARLETKRAEELRDEAARKSRRVVHELKEAGLSGSEAAIVLGVSTQRISQLVKS